MKVIEAMKKIKDLQQKAADLREKVALNCADLDFETPKYGSAEDQQKQVDAWLQAHTDIMDDILRLRTAIQRTNLLTRVSIELGGKVVEKTMAEWIHRRRDLAKLELEMWGKLTDRNLKEGFMDTSTGGKTQVRIRRYFVPQKRDEQVSLYRSEPLVIDSTLEVVNATTDLVE